MIQEKLCASCGKPFRPYGIKHGRIKYCSQPCYWKAKSEMMKGKVVAYPKLKLTLKLPREEWKWAYLAGLVDGEGSVGFRKNPLASTGRQGYVSVYNTDLDMLNWIVDNFGGRINKVGLGPRGRKPEYCWNARSLMDVMLLVEGLRPYLITKGKNANMVLQEARETYLIRSTNLLNQELGVRT